MSPLPTSGMVNPSGRTQATQPPMKPVRFKPWAIQSVGTPSGVASAILRAREETPQAQAEVFDGRQAGSCYCYDPELHEPWGFRRFLSPFPLWFILLIVPP
jgi:hypothetical protein